MFIPGIFFREGNPPKKVTIPQTAARLCALNLFFGRDNEIYHEKFLLMDNRHRKLSVIKQSKGCKFIPNCTKMRLAAGLRPNPLGELMRCPDPLAAMGGTSKGREGRGLLL